MTTVTDKRRERPKTRKVNRSLKALCKPEVLRVIIGAGRATFIFMKVAIEMIRWWRE